MTVRAELWGLGRMLLGVKTNAERVLDFHQAIGAELPASPRRPSAQLLALRRTLIREEYQEVLDAMDALEAGTGSDARDLAPLAQELADLLYVTYGALASLGVDADAVFAEVHRANLDKVRGPKRADGKQLKPAGWRPADVVGVLQALRDAPL